MYYNRICGKLLGDGSITKQAGRQPRFQFMHRIEDKEWTEYGYEQLKNFLPLLPPAYSKVTDPRLKAGYSERYIMQSRVHQEINALYDKWYPLGKKKIPFDFLNNYLNEEALSWWYQDDGHLKVVNGLMKKIILSTDSFTEKENKQLINMLYDKFRLTFSRDGQNRLILYDQFQIIYFLQLIAPWPTSGMGRKAAVELPLRPIAKRTTVYLPDDIIIKRPTFEINEQIKNLEEYFKTKDITRSLLEYRAQSILSTNYNENRISYQITIREDSRIFLSRIRQLTGLSVSDLISFIFKKKCNRTA